MPDVVTVNRRARVENGWKREARLRAGRQLTILCAAIGITISGASCVSDGMKSRTRQEYPDALNKALRDQHFRGRWWSFYERARILQEFEQWEDAESDLAVALSLRPRDQWRARTYGLHFASEYFPNREMGAVLFAQQRYDEAISHLERSIEQQYSARAAFYLNKARERIVSERGLDDRPPSFRLVAPSTAEAIAQIEPHIVGVAEDDTYVSAVFVNDQSVPLRVWDQSVTISHPVRLFPGENRVSIRVQDVAGRVTDQEIVFAADHDGPAVSFDAQPEASGRIAGLVRDPSGVASLVIGGTPVRLANVRDETYRFQTSLDRPVGQPAVNFTCVDGLGNITSGVIPTYTASARANRTRVQVAASTLGPNVVPAQTEGPMQVFFTNLRDGQRYLSGQIVVGVAINALQPVSQILLGDEPVDDFVEGRRLQRITRRIPLDAVGMHDVTVLALDVDGNTATASVQIERRLPQIDELSSRLRVAVLGNLWTSYRAEFEGYVDYITDELPLRLSSRGRFRVLERDDIGLVLDEQLLIEALGSSDQVDRLGNLEMTDFVLIGDLRRYGSNLEILLHAIDSLTTRETIVDVYGPASNLEELRILVENLALRLEQEFPRVQGEVIRARSGTVVTDLTELDRVRRAMRCIVFRREEVFDPVTGDSLGTDLIPLAEGSLREVRKDDSVVEILEKLVEEDSDRTAYGYVLTK